MKTELYQLNPDPLGYIIKKFDEDFEVQSTWAMVTDSRGGVTCLCWQGHRGWCRHKSMLQDFQSAGHIGDGWFLCHATREWREPLS